MKHLPELSISWVIQITTNFKTVKSCKAHSDNATKLRINNKNKAYLEIKHNPSIEENIIVETKKNFELNGNKNITYQDL